MTWQVTLQHGLQTIILVWIPLLCFHRLSGSRQLTKLAAKAKLLQIAWVFANHRILEIALIDTFICHKVVRVAWLLCRCCWSVVRIFVQLDSSCRPTPQLLIGLRSLPGDCLIGSWDSAKARLEVSWLLWSGDIWWLTGASATYAMVYLFTFLISIFLLTLIFKNYANSHYEYIYKVS